MKPVSEINFRSGYSSLPGEFYSRPSPEEFPDPYLIHANPAGAELIGLDMATAGSGEFLSVFSGQSLVAGMDPIAMLYAGHQFGRYVPQLGDGRVMTLGEIEHQGQHWEVQLKGAGPTDFSRDGDGRAVLRSTIREYLCSEAMHGLGIPTTRVLAMLGSDMEVYRERIETAAILVRLAPSHVRFGSFEVFYHRRQYKQLKILADYVIRHDFPHLLGAPDAHLKLFTEVLDRSAKLVAQWQSVGFEHGVMNTDNMSVLGLTLDYGPYGFMEGFDPDWVCNHSDYHGRYAYAAQPKMMHWNLACFAETLLPLLDEQGGKEALQAAFNEFEPRYNAHYDELMAAKLGLRKVDDDSRELVADLLSLMAEAEADFTNTFRALSVENPATSAWLGEAFERCATFPAWLQRYQGKLLEEGEDARAQVDKMTHTNPAYILRNYLAQQAIEKAEKGDYSEINDLMRVLAEPYQEKPEFERFSQPAPDWATSLAISCSS
ncbi:MAG: protein adenylyltransferase SelO [bacterium]